MVLELRLTTEIRIPCRRPTLVATADRQPMARRPGAFVSVPASALIAPPVCPGEKRPSYVLYGRQQASRFSLYVPQELVPKSSAARTAVSGRVAKPPSFEAGEEPGFEKPAGLKGVQGCQPTDQFRRLGIAAGRLASRC